tara:strand:+ start:896 stop:1165 length:270 start_codon:yes stop_codon:yes gene_type:complete
MRTPTFSVAERIQDHATKTKEKGYAIECIARILLQDEIDRDAGMGSSLNAFERGGLFKAIEHLASGVNDKSEWLEDWMDKIMEVTDETP